MTAQERLDRHVLVVVIWLGLGAVAAVLMRLGWNGRPTFLLAGFAALLTAFAAHVVVNAMTATRFYAREVALGLAVYAASLAAFSLAVMLSAVARKSAVPGFAGFAVLLASAVAYMLTAYGPRGAFDAFDRIKRFRPERDARDEA